MVTTVPPPSGTPAVAAAWAGLLRNGISASVSPTQRDPIRSFGEILAPRPPLAVILDPRARRAEDPARRRCVGAAGGRASPNPLLGRCGTRRGFGLADGFRASCSQVLLQCGAVGLVRQLPDRLHRRPASLTAAWRQSIVAISCAPAVDPARPPPTPAPIRNAVSAPTLPSLPIDAIAQGRPAAVDRLSRTPDPR